MPRGPRSAPGTDCKAPRMSGGKREREIFQQWYYGVFTVDVMWCDEVELDERML